MRSSLVTALSAAGWSDSRICAALSALTVRPLPLASVSAWLQQNNLLKRDRAGQWTGTLLAIQDPEFQAGLDRLIEHLQLPGVQTIDTTQPEFALLGAGLVQTAEALELVAAEQVQQLYALGGGLLFPDGVTVEQLAAWREADLLDEALAVVQQRCAAVIEAAETAKRAAGATP